MSQFFYDGTAEQLADRLEQLSSAIIQTDSWNESLQMAQVAVERFEWKNLAPKLDDAIEKTLK